jgi:hypothetical protein
MKWFGLCLLLTFNSALSFAAEEVSLKSVADELSIKMKDNGKCLYGTGDLNRIQIHKWFWVYEDKDLVLPLSENLTPYWQCTTLRKNIGRDTRSRLISPSLIMGDLTGISDHDLKVTGKIRYMGIVPKSYRYDISVKGGVATASVRVHIKPDKKLDASDLALVDSNIAAAEGIWNRHAALVNPNFRFSFKRVEKKEDAHFSIGLKEKFTRGPYYKRWSLAWPITTYAHEIGHMMGLDDEYSNLNATLFTLPTFLISGATHLDFGSDRMAITQIKEMSCDLNSIMCYDEMGSVQAHHLYIIFARIFQQDTDRNQRTQDEENSDEI